MVMWRNDVAVYVLCVVQTDLIQELREHEEKMKVCSCTYCCKMYNMFSSS